MSTPELRESSGKKLWIATALVLGALLLAGLLWFGLAIGVDEEANIAENRQTLEGGEALGAPP